MCVASGFHAGDSSEDVRRPSNTAWGSSSTEVITLPTSLFEKKPISLLLAARTNTKVFISSCQLRITRSTPLINFIFAGFCLCEFHYGLHHQRGTMAQAQEWIDTSPFYTEMHNTSHYEDPSLCRLCLFTLNKTTAVFEF